jgi:divalent metal cation (Fe/Co/Zn/Cd) transporter
VTHEPTIVERGQLLRTALRLAYFTVAWNVVEGVVAIWAAFDSGSDALLGFGLDSVVESISAVVLIWRLRVERRDPERADEVERRALRLIGVTFFILAAYVTYESVTTFINRERPDASAVGIVITSLSLIVMPILARRKEAVGESMHSMAVLADAAETRACFYLSIVVLGGLVLNAVLGWWWADPLAALGVVAFLVKEGREALTGKHDDHYH